MQVKKMPIISKEQFCQYLNAIDNFQEKQSNVADFFHNYFSPTSIPIPFEFGSECIDIIIDLLSYNFKSPEYVKDWIEYFLYEDGRTVYIDDQTIDISTTEALYDFLIAEYAS